MAPYKVLRTLLDRPEIRNFLLKDIILDVFRAFYHLHNKFSESEKKLAKPYDPNIRVVIIVEVGPSFGLHYLRNFVLGVILNYIP